MYTALGKLTAYLLVIIFMASFVYEIRALKFREYALNSMISMEEFLATAKTGDILMTRGLHRYGTNISIEYITRNVIASQLFRLYTHSNLIVRVNDKVYVYTAYDTIKFDVISGTYKRGAMLTDAREYIHNYHGNACLLRMPNNFIITEADIKNFIDMARQNSKRDFDTNIIRNINTVVKAYPNKDIADESICSQSVVMGLQALGLMDKSIWAPNAHPGDIYDFAVSHGYSKPLMVENLFTKGEYSEKK